MNHENFKYTYMPGDVLRVVRPTRNHPPGHLVVNYLTMVPLNLLDTGMKQVVDTQADTPTVTFDTIVDQLVRDGRFREVDASQLMFNQSITLVDLSVNGAGELQAHLNEYIMKGRHVEYAMFLDHAMSLMLDIPQMHLNRTLPVGYVIASKDPVEGFLATNREDYIASTVVFSIQCMFDGRPEVIATLRPIHLYRYAAGINPTYDPVTRQDIPLLVSWLQEQLTHLFMANHVRLMVGAIDCRIYTCTDRATQSTMRMKIGLEEGTLGYKLLACIEPRHLREPIYPTMHHAVTNRLALSA